MILTSKGEVTLAIHNGVWCSTKARNESKVTIKKYEESTCVIPDTPTTPEKKGVSIEDKMKESSEVMSLDPDNNPRYVGSNPNNYVKFNDELWRIIGVFNGQAKIIRNDLYSQDLSWDRNGYNDWSQATLQQTLNDQYLKSIIDRKYIDEKHKWNLGYIKAQTTDPNRNDCYRNERGDALNAVPNEWEGAIALIYPSDYFYSTSSNLEVCNQRINKWYQNENKECHRNSWLYSKKAYILTLTYLSSKSYGGILRISSGGGTVMANSSQTGGINGQGFFPTLYLKSDVKIFAGEGTLEQPFELSI